MAPHHVTAHSVNKSSITRPISQSPASYPYARPSNRQNRSCGEFYVHFVYTSLVLWISTAALPMWAQSPSPSVYTLHTDVRVVLTDVTVTDVHGNPVHGLDRS